MDDEEIEYPEPENESDTQKAALCHGLGIVTGFIAPLIFVLTQKEDGFVLGQAKEALNFQLTFTVIFFVNILLMFVFIGLITTLITAVVWFMLQVVAVVRVLSEEYYRYPLTVRLVK